MLVRRLLLAASGGSSLDEMTPAELAIRQDLAALLDPAAYVFAKGTGQSVTVPTGERWYLLSGWYLQATGGGASFFHRQADFRDAMPLPAGTTIQTDASNAGSDYLICKPSLVNSGSRYADPGLYFERMERLFTLPMRTIGAVRNAGDNTTATTAFPTDFANGLILHVSQHDLAWAALDYSDGTTALALLNEISDADPSRFAETIILPFSRTTFPRFKVRGVTAAPDQGRGTLHYVPLPADW